MSEKVIAQSEDFSSVAQPHAPQNLTDMKFDKDLFRKIFSGNVSKLRPITVDEAKNLKTLIDNTFISSIFSVKGGFNAESNEQNNSIETHFKLFSITKLEDIYKYFGLSYIDQLPLLEVRKPLKEKGRSLNYSGVIYENIESFMWGQDLDYAMSLFQQSFELFTTKDSEQKKFLKKLMSKLDKTVVKYKELLNYSTSIQETVEGYENVFKPELMQFSSDMTENIERLYVFINDIVRMCFFSYNESLIKDLSVINGVRCYVWKDRFLPNSLSLIEFFIYSTVINHYGIEPKDLQMDSTNLCYSMIRQKRSPELSKMIEEMRDSSSY